MSFDYYVRMYRDTSGNFTTAAPTLALGEVGYETDTAKLKIGDGSTVWASLAYFTPGGAPTGTAGGGLGGTYPNPTVLGTFTGQLISSGAVTTVTTTGNITDETITNTVYRWNGASAASLHGIQGQTEGRIVIIENVTSGQVLTLKHQSATEGTAARRLICPDQADTQLGPQSAAVLEYDNTSLAWRVIQESGYTGTPAAIVVNSGAGAGIAGDLFARGSHIHQINTSGAASNVTPQSASASGSGSSLALIDHGHHSPGGFGAITSAVNVDGTVNETDIVANQNIGSSAAGTTFRCMLSAKVSTRAVAGDTVTLKFYVGSAVMGQHAVAFASGISTKIIIWTLVATLRSRSATGTAALLGLASSVTAALNSGQNVDVQDAVSGSIDTTGSTIKVTATWSNGNSSNKFDVDVAVLEIVQM